MDRPIAAIRVPWDALLAVAFLTVGVLGLRLVHDFELWDEVVDSASPSRARVALALREKGEVRRRPGDAWVWRDLPSGSVELANGDSVFTGSGGEAELFFDGGARVKVGPGSLVVVRVERKAAGGLEWLKSLKKIMLPAPRRAGEGQVLEVRAGRAEVSAGAAPLEVRTSDGRNLVVDAGKSVTAETLAPAIEEMPVAAAVAEPSPMAAPAAQRKSVSPSKPGILKVNRSAQVVAKKKTGATRVRASAAEGSTRLEEDLDKIDVLLKWEPVEGANEFRVRLYSGAGTLIHEATVQRAAAELALRDLDGTEYSYEVEASLEDGATVASGRIPLEIRLAAPEPVSPPRGAEFEAGAKALLTWERTALTNAYHLLVAADPEFSRVVADHTGAMNLFVFRPERKGTHYWRVQSVGRKWKSDWSGTRSFEVR